MTDLLNRVETRARQLILQYKQLQADNKSLKQEIAALKQEISDHEARYKELQAQYDHLKMAKYIDMADSSTKDLRGRIRKMVRDIDQCVAMLKAE